MNTQDVNLALAEQAFDDYYRRGGKGLADDVWRRIAERHGVLGYAPSDGWPEVATADPARFPFANDRFVYGPQTLMAERLGQ